MGKTYERLLNNRIVKEINISQNQAGGRKEMCLSDHILRIKVAIKQNKLMKKDTYVTFLDVTKAYDKAWLKGIMYVMDKQGCKGAAWKLTDKLNQNLTATIRTAFGNTRPIKIKNNNIRQGGVLAVAQYSTLMDEISKEIERNKTNENTTIDKNSIGLLWIDDVALVTNNLTDQTTLLNITGKTANKYRIEFGKEKSKILKIGRRRKEHVSLKHQGNAYTKNYKSWTQKNE